MKLYIQNYADSPLNKNDYFLTDVNFRKSKSFVPGDLVFWHSKESKVIGFDNNGHNRHEEQFMCVSMGLILSAYKTEYTIQWFSCDSTIGGFLFSNSIRAFNMADYNRLTKRYHIKNV